MLHDLDNLPQAQFKVEINKNVKGEDDNYTDSIIRCAMMYKIFTVEMSYRCDNSENEDK